MNSTFSFTQDLNQLHRSGRRAPRFARLISFAITFIVFTASAQAQLEVIVSAGDLAPSGVDTIHILGPALIRADGQMSFYAGLNSISYDENPAHIRAILQTRGEEIVSVLQESKVADPTWELTTSVQNDAGLFAYTGKRPHTFYGYLVNVVETIDPNGVVTKYYQTSVGWEPLSPPALNASGAVAFAAEGVVHRGMDGTLAVIALNRQEVADGSGQVFGLNNSYQSSPIINATGEVAFTAQVRVGGFDKSAVFRGNGSGLPTVVARTGMQLPDGSSLTGAFRTFPALNDAGDIAMFMESENSWWIAEAIYRDRAGTLAPIAKIGDAAPDGNGVLANVNAAGIFRNVRPAMNQRGEVAFIAELSDTAAGELDNTAIYRGDGSVLTQIARRGQTVPTGDGVFERFYVVLGNNAYGEVAFMAGVTDHGQENSGIGIFLGNGIDTIQIAENGQSFDGEELTIPFGPRIESLTDPYRTYLNDRGQLAFNATVAGVWKNFRFTPPEVSWQNVAGGQWSNAQNWAGQMPPGSLYQTRLCRKCALGS